MKQRKTFKKKWNEVDEVCPYCNQVTKINRGLTKQNLKNMFQKPTPQDWIIFIILILSLYGFWVYTSELNYYSELLANTPELCQKYDQGILDNFLNDTYKKDNVDVYYNPDIKIKDYD